MSETRDIGTYNHPQGSGNCYFAADVFVDTSAKTVTVDGGISCGYFGIEADQCTYEVNAVQNNRTYSNQQPTGRCTDEAPPGSRARTWSCDNPSDCTGTWYATGAAVVRGYPGTVWRARNSGACNTMSNGEVIACNYTYVGTTL